MSYDITHSRNDWNITFNMGPLFRHIFPPDEMLDEPTHEGINVLHGMTGKRAQEFLGAALASCCDIERRGEEHKWDSPNGWGSFKSARIVLTEMLVSCLQNPQAYVKVYK